MNSFSLIKQYLLFKIAIKESNMTVNIDVHAPSSGHGRDRVEAMEVNIELNQEQTFIPPILQVSK